MQITSRSNISCLRVRVEQQTEATNFVWLVAMPMGGTSMEYQGDMACAVDAVDAVIVNGILAKGSSEERIQNVNGRR